LRICTKKKKVNIAGLDIGQRIFLRDLKVPEGVELGAWGLIWV